MIVTSVLLFLLILQRLRAYQNLHEKLDARQLEYEEFLFATSHHLRTPLVTISGFSNEIATISQAEQSSSSAELIDFSSRIQRGVRQMEGVLKSMTRLHRNLRERPKPELVDPEKVMRSLFQQIPHDDPPASMQIIGNLPPLFVDAGHFRILIQELFMNSLQHRPKDQAIVITVRSETFSNHIALSISDNGPGFELKDSADIFQPILRKQNIHELGNIRMGLAIALRCARWNGGDLHITSTPGQGTLVQLRLPRN